MFVPDISTAVGEQLLSIHHFSPLSSAIMLTAAKALEVDLTAQHAPFF